MIIKISRPIEDEDRVAAMAVIRTRDKRLVMRVPMSRVKGLIPRNRLAAYFKAELAEDGDLIIGKRLPHQHF